MKFKVLNTDTNKITELKSKHIKYLIDDSNNVYMCGYHISDYMAHLKPLFSTGLTGKNEVEIYEGDIVEYGGVKYQVDFCNSYSCGGWYLFREDLTLETTCDNWYDCLVIGNIYENEELMK